MRTKLTAVFVSIFMLFLAPAFAKEITTLSPDKKIEISISQKSGAFSYAISVDGKAIIDDAPISITIDGNEYPGSAQIGQVKRERINQTLEPVVPIITDTIRESCNETLIAFDGPVSLRVRAYNDGVAFRWESSIDKDEIIVNSETFTTNFEKDYDMYYALPNGWGFFSHQENTFKRMKISETPGEEKIAAAPLLFDLGKDKYAVLTDVNVSGYPGLWIKGMGGTKMEGIFPHYPEKTELDRDRNLKVAKYSDFLAKTKGTRTYPWRAFVIGSPDDLLTSALLYTLAAPNRIGDTSWIKPGKVAWDWYNAWNITDVPFEAGINQDTYKNYIDFASNNDLEYIILDEGWSVKGPDKLLDVTTTLDIDDLVKYGKSKNVGIILWMTAVSLEHSFDQAFDQFSKWGIKGMKVDFMQRDDQVMMDFCEKVAETAASHHFIVDFHGGSKPTGLQRTYPNVLTQESVLGLEQSKWSRRTSPDRAVLLPFTRMMAGPMDYTPGAMDNYNKEKFVIDYDSPGSQGTRCHQLAMYVVYLSPLQMLADTPTKYRKNPECLPFLSKVPTTWNETAVLKAEVGKVVAVARRHGDTWFIGAMSDWTPRELAFNLDFLGEGQYRLKYWADGPNAAEEATDTTIGQAMVTAESGLRINLAPGGGYAAILEPVE